MKAAELQNDTAPACTRDGVAAVELQDGVEHAEVVEAAGVGGGVVRHEEPEERPDEIL